MNTMMSTILHKISVIYIIIIIMNQCQFASTKNKRKTCKGWILKYHYEENFITDYEKQDNLDLAIKRNTAPLIWETQSDAGDPLCNSEISIFALVYGQYIAKLNVEDVIKPSKFCEKIGMKSDYMIDLAKQGTEFYCKGWIRYYGYLTKDNGSEANWDMAKALGTDSLFDYMHGIVREYIKELRNRQKQDAISANSFCQTYGHYLYKFNTGTVKPPYPVDKTEDPTYNIHTTGASSSNS